VSVEQTELTQQAYQTGRDAFERGQYRQSILALEKAAGLADRASVLGGEIQTWLVTAYEAVGERSQAIDLCRQLCRHPDWQTRKQNRRLLAILEAPRLVTRPEWLTQIPDLGALEEDRNPQAYCPSATLRKKSTRKTPDPQMDLTDWHLSEAKDDRFIWVGLGVIALVLGGLVWLS